MPSADDPWDALPESLRRSQIIPAGPTPPHRSFTRGDVLAKSLDFRTRKPWNAGSNVQSNYPHKCASGFKGDPKGKAASREKAKVPGRFKIDYS
jgi:hypothetical protein